jgi:hypothetical protein
MNRIFVPITCGVCLRYSALSFPKVDLKQKLAADSAIELRCVYDDVKWDATPAERGLMERLLSENDAVDRAPRLFATATAVEGVSLSA